jgi:hypothetical protein
MRERDTFLLSISSAFTSSSLDTPNVLPLPKEVSQGISTAIQRAVAMRMAIVVATRAGALTGSLNGPEKPTVFLHP